MDEFTDESICEAGRYMLPLVKSRPLNEVAQECDARLNLPRKGSSLRIARYLIALRRWPVDLSVRIDSFLPLRFE